MADFKKGTLIGIKKNDKCYYYLVLSEPMFFGCQWAYAFHQTSIHLLSQSEILSGYGEGFHALIDFNLQLDEFDVYKIGEGINIEPYRMDMNSKVRIDQPGGGHEWYIFNQKLQILRKQKTLKSGQMNLPIASGMTCVDAKQLIDKKWRTEQIVEEEGQGQFPI
ncbi:hypothetical protein [Rhodohalobacter sp. 614A]|uniref:hypothetical protein n=1 Tax=Rhodohalobacter sp. 614A TaxID=2908649 RepID=UPI001F288AAA|nr:hypothetical protein [Rhodohalobacter sp. 614A]